MKKCKTVITGMVTIALFTLSCQKQQEENSLMKSEFKEMEADALLSSGQSGKAVSWIPGGSKVENESAAIRFTPANGWAYAGYNTRGQLLDFGLNATGQISCDCTSEKGNCLPFTAESLGNTISGCTLEDGCTRCNAEMSVYSYSHNSYVSLVNGGYYKPDAKTEIVPQGKSLPSVFDALLELPVFQKELSEFYRTAYGNRQVQKPGVEDNGEVSAPRGHVFLVVSIMGRGLLAVVPESFANAQHVSQPAVRAKCHCTEGNCSIEVRSIGIASATFCDGNCTGTCTLKLRGTRPTHQVYDASLVTYTF